MLEISREGCEVIISWCILSDHWEVTLVVSIIWSLITSVRMILLPSFLVVCACPLVAARSFWVSKARFFAWAGVVLHPWWVTAWTTFWDSYNCLPSITLHTVLEYKPEWECRSLCLLMVLLRQWGLTLRLLFFWEGTSISGRDAVPLLQKCGWGVIAPCPPPSISDIVKWRAGCLYNTYVT